MKTKVLILTAIFSLGIVFQGCEKEKTPLKSNSQNINDNKKIKAKGTINKSTDSSYTIIDTLDFPLETEEDFLNALNLLEENQFLSTKRDENGDPYVVIAENENGEPNYPPSGDLYYCSYSGSQTAGNTEWRICLSGAISYYNLREGTGYCPDIAEGNGYIKVYSGPCV